jgi:hypothetical protein
MSPKIEEISRGLRSQLVSFTITTGKTETGEVRSHGEPRLPWLAVYIARHCFCNALHSCRNGYSHRPDEYAMPEDIARGTLVLAETLAAFSQKLLLTAELVRTLLLALSSSRLQKSFLALAPVISP